MQLVAAIGPEAGHEVLQRAADQIQKVAIGSPDLAQLQGALHSLRARQAIRNADYELKLLIIQQSKAKPVDC